MFRIFAIMIFSNFVISLSIIDTFLCCLFRVLQFSKSEIVLSAKFLLWDFAFIRFCFCQRDFAILYSFV